MKSNLIQMNDKYRGDCAIILCQQSALEVIDAVEERLRKSQQHAEHTTEVKNRLIGEIAIFEVYVVCRQLFSIMMPVSRIGRAFDKWTGGRKEEAFRLVESAIMTAAGEKFRRDFAVERIRRYSEGGDFFTVSMRFTAHLQECAGEWTVDTTMDLAGVTTLIWGEAAKVADFIMKGTAEQILVTSMKSLNNMILPELAIKKAEQILKIIPDHAHALFSKGFALARLGKTEGLPYMDRAAELDPEINEWMRKNGVSAEGERDLTAFLDK